MRYESHVALFLTESMELPHGLSTITPAVRFLKYSSHRLISGVASASTTRRARVRKPVHIAVGNRPTLRDVSDAITSSARRPSAARRQWPRGARPMPIPLREPAFPLTNVLSLASALLCRSGCAPPAQGEIDQPARGQAHRSPPR